MKMEFGDILENAILSTDPANRSQAEQQLSNLANGNIVMYMGLLTEALANEAQKTEVRMLAGIALKNQLTAKDPKTRQFLVEQWIAIDAGNKHQIKNTALNCLLSSDDRVANSAAQLIAAMADIELPRGDWPELMSIMVENTKESQPVNVKRASLLTIGYICESADPTNPGVVSQANGILIAIVQCARSSEPSKIVRLTAINSLVNSLEFIRYNFEREGERNYIMQVVCEATQADDIDIQASAFGALSRIMSLYYSFMSIYMEKALYGLTVAGMQSSDERVACMAVEFWSTVCEEELEIAIQREEFGDALEKDSPELTSFNFALVAIQDVLPTLLTLLNRQNEDPEDEDWSVAMAAGACLQLFSQNTGNYVVQPTLQFVEKNLQDPSWRNREAAVMAFGSILDGPDREQLKVLIGQALAPILNLIKDEALQVRETVAWCLGRIADLVVDAIDISQHLSPVVEAVYHGLGDHPKVSTNCCWTLMNLVEQLCQDGAHQQTTVMSQYYSTLIPALVELSGKGDNEFSSRASAYEALSTLVLCSSEDDMPAVNQVAAEVLARLDATIGMSVQANSSEERIHFEELQTSILSVLTNVIRRAGPNVLAVSDNLMEKFIKLLQQQDGESLIDEDVFIAISALAGASGEHFLKYMEAFLPFLSQALQNTESSICNTAIGLVADISHSLGGSIAPFCHGLMNILGNNLQNSDLRRELRPLILSCFGDIASSVGDQFIEYLQVVMDICAQAQTLQPEDSSLESLDYILSVREAVLDAYVGMIGGLHDRPDAIYPFTTQVFQFLLSVYSDINMTVSDHVCRSVVGIFGDLAMMYPDGRIKNVFLQDWVTEFIRKTRANAAFQQSTKDTARWAREQQKKQLNL